MGVAEVLPSLFLPLLAPESWFKSGRQKEWDLIWPITERGTENYHNKLSTNNTVALVMFLCSDIADASQTYFRYQLTAML
jgi:hypothetical protein